MLQAWTTVSQYCYRIPRKGIGYIFKGGKSFKIFLLPSGKGSTLKEKNLLSFCVLIKKLRKLFQNYHIIQSTLVILKSKGLSEILRDILISTYQICRRGKKIIQTTTSHKWICNLTPENRDILKILWKRGEMLSPLFHIIFLPDVIVSC